MTPLWLETHSSYIDGNRSTTADQITFNAGSINSVPLLRVPLVNAGVLTDETPLTVEITVANDVSIGQGIDSDIIYGVSDGANFIGFQTVNKGNYHKRSPCYGIEGQSGERLTVKTRYGMFSPLPWAIVSFYPDQFVFTLKLDRPWGSCFTVHGGGFIKTAEYSKWLLLSQGLTLEVYKSSAREKVGIKYIKITIMKTED